MDLAIYISELLGFKGEVNVPGLGHFTQNHISASYNEQEHKFYPPRYEVTFDPQFTDDEGLANYITSKKNISLASAKYFIDKYVTALKQQIAQHGADIAGIGHLYYEYATLRFKAGTARASGDPASFGLPPVTLHKRNERPVATPVPPEKKPVPVAQPAIEESKAEEPAEGAIIGKTTAEIEEMPAGQTPDYVYEEDVPKRRNGWIVFLLILIIVLIGIPGLYMYKPSLFDNFIHKNTVTKIVVVKDTDSVAKPALKNDSVVKPVDSAAKPALRRDSATKQPGNAVAPASILQDSTKPYWIVVGSSFVTKKAADQAIANYKSIGITAGVASEMPGRRIKLKLGTYNTEPEAENARRELIKSGKVRKDIYTQKIIPKK
ncbi:MAG: SPOR domain-containing protein [Bacteroidetes bacterium]|nr:SPOR domain-containing protein [Bacteroidota bacterium]